MKKQQKIEPGFLKDLRGARQLVTMLLALINDDPLEQRRVEIRPKLLLRASTGS